MDACVIQLNFWVQWILISSFTETAGLGLIGLFDDFIHLYTVPFCKTSLIKEYNCLDGVI